MKNIHARLVILTFSLTLSCNQVEKKEPQKEISIEKKKINDSLVRAKIITKITTGEKITEEISLIRTSAADHALTHALSAAGEKILAISTAYGT